MKQAHTKAVATLAAILAAAAVSTAASAQTTTPAAQPTAPATTQPATAAPSGAASATSTQAPMTVAQVLKAKDDERVVMEGTIVRKVRHERYEFRDNSGTITIEVDDDKWPDGKPMIEQRVRLRGEVEKKVLTRRTEVEADWIEAIR